MSGPSTTGWRLVGVCDRGEYRVVRLLGRAHDVLTQYSRLMPLEAHNLIALQTRRRLEQLRRGIEAACMLSGTHIDLSQRVVRKTGGGELEIALSHPVAGN